MHLNVIKTLSYNKILGSIFQLLQLEMTVGKAKSYLYSCHLGVVI